MDATPKTPPVVIYIATSGHGHKSHTTRMEHPAQNAGVDQVLKCAQDNLAAIVLAVENDDVGKLRSLLQSTARSVDSVVHGANTEADMVMLLDQVAAEDTKKGKTEVQKEEKTHRQKAAAALEAKACEVAAGMDVRVDKSGQLVTMVKATKAASDEDTWI